MKSNRFVSISFLLAFVMSTLILPSCRVKEGCPTKDYTNTMDKKKRKGSSNLFPKSMRKKMR